MRTLEKSGVVFRPVPGARLTKPQATSYGQRLQELASSRGGLTPEDVVEDAQVKDAAYHEYFEWDDAIAGEQYRLVQARYLLRSIEVVVYQDGEQISQPIRAYFPVEKLNEEDNGVVKVYASVQEIGEDPALREQIIERARHELEGWVERYREYRELEQIAIAIEEALERDAVLV